MYFNVIQYCGYVSSDIEDYVFTIPNFTNIIDYVNTTRECISKEEYRHYPNTILKTKLAIQFYKHYLICSANNDIESAFYAILHAAWDCDDLGDTYAAVFCRKLAIEEINKLILATPHLEELKVQKADLLRRTGMFTCVIEDYGSINLSDNILQKIILFQIEKSKVHDNKCYTVADVLNS